MIVTKGDMIMKNIKKVTVMTVLILVFSGAFCGICLAMTEKEAGFSVTYTETFATTEENTQEETVHTHYVEDDSDEETETETTTRKTTTTRKPTTTAKPETTRKPTTTGKPSTTVPQTKYDISEMEERLLNETWTIYFECSEYNLRFFSNGTFEIYDDCGNICTNGRYGLDGNNLYLFDNCGNVISYMEYDISDRMFYSPDFDKDSITEITEPVTETDNGILDVSNVGLLLSDAVYCYDGCINTTSLNLEFDYEGEYITCPHCGFEAYPVTNFDSRADLENYIDEYLTGNAKETACEDLDDRFNNNLFTEKNGKLYVCTMYNDRGFCRIDPDTIRFVIENSDGSYTIAVEDYDRENTYYLDVYYIDGTYKIG